jgi:Cu/Ag efflux protein CusF
MTKPILSAVFALVCIVCWPAFSHAQAPTEPVLASPARAVTLTYGEIKRVDLDAGKVTIKHGEIKNLDMPPMTMVFVAKDRAQLNALKVGDKVQFGVLNEVGKLIAADIQLLP